MAQNSKDTSQYLTTDTIDWYLGPWNARRIPVSEFDKIIAIPNSCDKRPDKLSLLEYGTPRLWWTFAMRNPDLLFDPFEDFVAGLEIYIPGNILKQ